MRQFQRAYSATNRLRPYVAALRSVAAFAILTVVVALTAFSWASAAEKALQPASKGDATALTKLPQAHDYQRTLRRFMATLREEDFEHGVSELPTAKAAVDDPEYLYRHYVYTLMSQPLVGTKRGPPAINAPPRLFLLSSIETEGGVLQPPVWPETLASFVRWSYPGNPFHDNRALKLRAFVTAAVMMIMLDDFLESDPELGRGDRFSYQLVYFGLPYRTFKDVLPPDVQRAYEEGLKKLGERVLAWGIRGEELHNDITAPFGLLCAAKAIDDAKFSQAVEDYARRLYTEPRYFSPAGYWPYRGGPDISFNGHANYFAVTTALAANWPFVNEALGRVYRLRGHLILPEPDGTFSGPSHFNSRLSGPASSDQWAWGGARDVAAAMVTDEAAHLVKLPGDDVLRDAPAQRARLFAANIAENPRDAANERFLTNDEITSHTWKWRLWQTFNFPASVNAGYEFYPPGTYSHRQTLEKMNSPLLKSPFERGETFVREFGREFVVSRQPAFAAILHTGPIGGQDPGDKMRQFLGPMGLSGGQLSAFWTPGTGSILLGQRGGMANDKSFDLAEEWRTWPNHSVSGQTASGVFFTSARIQKPATFIDIAGNTAAVRVSGVIPASIVGQEKSISGKYEYARSFKIDGQGVSVETSVSGDGAEPIAELYETLPVYLRDSQHQPNAKPTVIEFKVDDKWSAATENFVSQVEAVRLSRFTGAVLITFDAPRRAKLSPTDWADSYLSRGTARNVLIDLLESSDQPAALKAPRKVGYRIEPVAN